MTIDIKTLGVLESLCASEYNRLLSMWEASDYSKDFDPDNQLERITLARQSVRNEVERVYRDSMDLQKEVVQIEEQKGRVAAIRHIKDVTGWSLEKSKRQLMVWRSECVI